MAFRRVLSVTLILIFLTCGCGRSERAEIETTRAELATARAEIAKLNERISQFGGSSNARGYLDDLEKLSALKEKNIITPDEFERQKKVILEGQKTSTVADPEPAPGMDELAKQLRSLHALFNAATITVSERDAKKALLIHQPLRAADLAKDLETAKALFNGSIITSADFEAIKKSLLGLSGKDDHGHH